MLYFVNILFLHNRLEGHKIHGCQRTQSVQTLIVMLQKITLLLISTLFLKLTVINCQFFSIKIGFWKWCRVEASRHRAVVVVGTRNPGYTSIFHFSS